MACVRCQIRSWEAKHSPTCLLSSPYYRETEMSECLSTLIHLCIRTIIPGALITQTVRLCRHSCFKWDMAASKAKGTDEGDGVEAVLVVGGFSPCNP